MAQRYWRDGNGRLNCQHGVILHGDSCVTCEREAATAAAKASFDEDHHVGPSRGGRGSIKRSHRAEGRNWAGE